MDARSDLYSVGIVLYEFVTGRRPFLANSEYSIMAAHLNQAPKPPLELNPGLPAALNEIILMAIAKDPAKRFQAAEAFANALTTVPASSAVAPTVPRTPLAGPTGGSTERPAGFWEASPTLERPAAPRISNCVCGTDDGDDRADSDSAATHNTTGGVDSDAGDGYQCQATTPTSAATARLRNRDAGAGGCRSTAASPDAASARPAVIAACT